MAGEPLMQADLNAQSVQALAPSDGLNITVAGTSARDAIPANAKVVRLASLVDCWIKFGDDTVVATSGDVLFPAGAEVFKVNLEGDVTHVAVLQVSVGGTLNVAKMA